MAPAIRGQRAFSVPVPEHPTCTIQQHNNPQALIGLDLFSGRHNGFLCVCVCVNSELAGT
jgi:hypothetical protein